MAHELAVAERMDVVALDPWTDPPTLIDVTPLCRVPALVTDTGDLIVESTTICEYLMEVAGQPMPPGGERLRIMARAALASGMMDAAFTAVMERRRPAGSQWPDWIDRQYRALTRTLPTIAAPPPGRFDLGDVTLACTLAYLDFRLPDLPWRELRADLARWLAGISDRRSMAASASR
jgi:glutathione S-transferase